MQQRTESTGCRKVCIITDFLHSHGYRSTRPGYALAGTRQNLGAGTYNSSIHTVTGPSKLKLILEPKWGSCHWPRALATNSANTYFLSIPQVACESMLKGTLFWDSFKEPKGNLPILTVPRFEDKPKYPPRYPQLLCGRYGIR